MSEQLRQSCRTPMQRFVTDPLAGVVVLCFILLFKVMPVRVASFTGGLIGRGFYRIMRRRNAIGRRNLEIAFPEKTVQEREQILKKMWEHWGRVYGELPHAAYLFDQADKEGLPYLKELNAKKQGCFVCSAHFGNFEISAATYLFDDYCLNPVYRAANNPWLDKILFQRRKGILIPKGTKGAKKMLQVLKAGKAVVILCDQKLREGIVVPFFGKPAMTAPAVATLAFKMGVPLYMARCVRGEKGKFKIQIYPLEVSQNPVESQAVYETMLRVNQEIERWIRQTPEQWLWIHRRFDKCEY